MIRPYTSADQEALLQILRLNTPTYFAPEEEDDFVLYLHERLEDYYVIEQDGQVVGAGGINYFDGHTWARLSWDLIHPAFQGKGIGRELTLFRINKLKEMPGMQWLQVRTSQLVYPFYQKLGFELEKVEQDFWAKGIDLYQMKMNLGA
ncbi:GNAT family N-acetyltransferase [Pontibacter lucknowensis]|uniref:N-acetylglutamate synthase, GNAT family n=1 Tax=Pontibacter lucknowensis TaxID=1077936 RepID=A0A1N7BD46_9BACT|nr:GNAT family N-acetyltransferase [Pontibacter lucknowensis]SIR49242.1 N-acetylglutamate synthase, GNAT family [Pontibacter lucknowensis]